MPGECHEHAKNCAGKDSLEDRRSFSSRADRFCDEPQGDGSIFRL